MSARFSVLDLLSSEGLHGFERGGAASGQPRGDNADEQEQRGCGDERERVVLLDAEEEAAEQVCREDADADTDGGAGEEKNAGVAEDEREDI